MHPRWQPLLKWNWLLLAGVRGSWLGGHRLSAGRRLPPDGRLLSVNKCLLRRRRQPEWFGAVPARRGRLRTMR